MKFGLTNPQLERLRKILRIHLLDNFPHAKVFVFGSRARENHRPGSDIDLLIESETPIPTVQLSKLRDALEESSFPYKVDLALASELSESYRAQAQRDKKALF
jgi:predicted nucleotidyltransferase